MEKRMKLIKWAIALKTNKKKTIDNDGHLPPAIEPNENR